jgi:hypothetical protein
VKGQDGERIEADRSVRWEGIPSERVVAVIASLDTGKVQVASGYLAARSVVLTARHCVVDKKTGRAARSLKVVRRSDGRPASAQLSAAAFDTAVLTLSGDRAWGRTALSPPIFGRVDTSHSGELYGCEAVGFPLWQFDPREHHRDAAELHGTIRVTEGAEAGILIIRDPLLGDVAVPETAIGGDLVPESPWGGLSGALVFHRGSALGVIVEHHPRQGRSALTIQPIARIAQCAGEGDESCARVAAALGLAGHQDLPMVKVPLRPGPTVGVGTEAVRTGLPGVTRRQVTAGQKIFELPVARRNEHFTGRGNLLARLGAMKAGEPTAVLQAVTGLGGIGKTELVVEYGYCHQEDYELVYTLRADTDAVLLEDMRGLARRVGLSQARDGLTARVNRWLRSHRGWLLIFDNADSLPGLTEYLPDGPGHVLITSRDAVWRQRAAVVEVDVWEPTESVEFLRSRLAASLVCDGAAHVAELLGHFPLALEQAAGFMEANGVTCTAYARLYQERSGDLLDAYAPKALGYDKTVAATWIVTFEAVQRSQPQALELLRLCAYLAPDALPESVFTRGSSVLPASLRPIVADPIAFNAALGELHRYRLVRRSGDGMLSMHRLVQHVVRMEARDAARDLAAASVRLISSVFSERESDDHADDGASGSSASVLFPHAIAAAAHAAAMDSEADLVTVLLTRAGDYVGRRARLAGTEATVADAVAITSQVYGNDTPEMAHSLTTLGRLLLAKDGLAAARACFERALAITENVHGLASTQAVDLRNELAETLVRQDDIAGAQAYLRGTGYLDDLGVEHGGTGGRSSQID